MVKMDTPSANFSSRIPPGFRALKFKVERNGNICRRRHEAGYIIVEDANNGEKGFCETHAVPLPNSLSLPRKNGLTRYVNYQANTHQIQNNRS
jgi:hypothetical protein